MHAQQPLDVVHVVVEMGDEQQRLLAELVAEPSSESASVEITVSPTGEEIRLEKVPAT